MSALPGVVVVMYLTFCLSVCLSVHLSVTLWHNFNKKERPTIMWLSPNSNPKTLVFSSLMICRNLKGITPILYTYTHSRKWKTVYSCCGSKLLLEWRRHHVLLQSTHADPKPSYTYDNACYYAIQITASQFLDKLRDASASVAQSCHYKVAAITWYVSETVQVIAKVTTECEYEVVCNLWNGVISNDLEWLLTLV